MGCKERLQSYLEENGVPFRTHQHPSGAFTAQEVAAAEHIPGNLLAKVVMVLAGEKLAMMVLPAPRRVDLERAAGVVGAGEARLAHEDEFEGAFPDCELGAEPPFGNLYDLPTYVDESMTKSGTFYFQAGTHSDTISMEFKDYERLANPVIAEFARDDSGGD